MVTGARPAPIRLVISYRLAVVLASTIQGWGEVSY